MSLVPTWPFAVGTLVIGLAAGAWADHAYMSGNYDKLVAQQAEQERTRQVQRAADEVEARKKEQSWVDLMGLNEQEHQDEVSKIRAAGAAAIAGVRNRADRQPSGTSGLSKGATACQGNTGAELSRPDSEFLIGIAQRADEQRAALGSCYRAYDAVR